MSTRHDVVLGAGLAGLAAAWALREAGQPDWLVFEKESRPGGHARSIVTGGYVFDYGPHILFTADRELEQLIRELLGENLRAQRRQAFIYHAAYERYTRFPFQAHLHGLPVELVTRCLVDLVEAVERRAGDGFSPGDYEEWLRGFFGTTIAEHLMIPYARKLWTVEPREMAFDWIGRRVPTPDVERILRGALTDDVAQVGATAEFWYPWTGGIESLPRALAERVPGIRLEHELERVELGARRLLFAGGETVTFDRLLFSLPLHTVPSLVDRVPPRVEAACAALRHQGICNVNVGVERERLSDLHWVYFYEDAFPFHRLSFPGNFSPNNVPPGRSAVSTEVAFSPRRPLARESVVEDTLAALRRAGILREDDRIDLVHVEEIDPAYVIYDLEHSRNVAIVRDWLAEQGITTIGRFGEWQYLNMDQAIRSGLEAGEALAGARRRSAAPAG